MKIRINRTIFFLIILLFTLILSKFLFFRLDLTSDKRFSITDQTKNLMHKIDQPLEIVIYLEGDLNPGFLRLKNATTEIIDELAVYSAKNISVKFKNPSEASSSDIREKNYSELQNRGLTPTMVYERDNDGKSVQKVIFPWLEIRYKNTTIPVCLLKNILGNSGEENLNISTENLEFEITDAIRRLGNKEVKKIAFIEGHGELNYSETYDISKSLSHYFQIDRGILASNASVLDAYKAIIIAKPTRPFSESDKFIIDQYIMHGGSVLWLIDGVRIANENLSSSGLSPAMELDVNLNDLLFRYGVRINPVILEDVQCTSVPVNIAPAKTQPQFEPTPWYYSPLLLTSPEHNITRNVSEVKADFCSEIDLVGDNKLVKSKVLLATSDNTHILGTPTTIDLSLNPKPNDKSYFNQGYVPVAVALEGNFNSDFINRMIPKGLTNTLPILSKSIITRQIVVADGDIIRNDTTLNKSDSIKIPLGYDRYMNQQFGNKDFIQNAVLYLTDDDGWMNLRSKTVKLRLLNKEISAEERLNLQLGNVLIPLIILLIFGILYQLIRKRKYTRN